MLGGFLRGLNRKLDPGGGSTDSGKERLKATYPQEMCPQMFFSASFRFFGLIVSGCFASSALALPPSSYLPSNDWLVEPGAFKSSIEIKEDGSEVVLQNGLVRRVIRLAPGGTTVALDNLMTGESLLRSPRPEAVITLDGREIPVGGWTGQPNHAYLTPEWLAAMKADPAAMVFTGMETGVPAARMEWKRVRHHAPDVEWPPKGVYLRLDYRMPDGGGAGESMASETGRKLLLDDPFRQMDPAWKVVASGHDERVGFQNEGKPGEIYAPALVHCFAQRGLPDGAGLIEVVMDPGTDRASSFGPGLAVVFESGKTAKVCLRPGDRGEHGHFETDGGALATVKALAAGDGGLDPGRSYRLRVRMEASELIWEVADAAADTPEFHRLFAMTRDASWGRAVAMRVGKMNRSGGASDAATDGPGEWGRCFVRRARVFGSFDAATVPKEQPQEAGITVSVHYELYDGVPLMSKWITVRNGTSRAVTLDRFTAELLAVVEHSNPVEDRPPVPLPAPTSLHVETDQAFGAFNSAQANRHAVRWRADPLFSTQVNYLRNMPCLLEVSPFRGPAQVIEPGAVFESFRVFILTQDSEDRERRGLAQRKMYRTLAPWITENPLMMHLRTADPEAVRGAIEQCVETGFEMIILSFGSGFDAENDSPEHHAKWKAIAAEAKAKGIELGSYSLLASRRVGGGHDVVSAPGESPAFGNAPALTSEWGLRYFEKLRKLYQTTGFGVFEHDGSYPGDWDVTPRPPLQRGLEDSQWAQWTIIRDFYRWCRAEGIYLNVPDFYFLTGSNKCGMGYREVNWSLPRAQQVIHTRQNIHDGTWDRTPSMGWMFVPLTEYQGGGAAATIEPLEQHLDHYERMMISNLAAGVQACYRGPRLYDSDKTRDMVKRQVAWFKRYRDILESDIIHLRRADGRDWDGYVHVNPGLKERALLAVCNPLDQPITREILVPLHYAGLDGEVMAAVSDRDPQSLPCDRFSRVRVKIDIPAGDFRWVVFRESDARR